MSAARIMTAGKATTAVRAKTDVRGLVSGLIPIGASVAAMDRKSALGEIPTGVSQKDAICRLLD
jgi:hypothetical protein